MYREKFGCFVRNENTLGYMQRVDGGALMFGILAGSVLRGGLNPINGAVHVNKWDTYRKATLKDFEEYRVCSQGYKL